MKNMKVSKKLMVSFLIVIAFTLVVAVFGFIGMMYINDSNTELYERQARPLLDLAQARETFQILEVTMRETLLARGNDEQLNAHRAAAEHSAALFTSYMAAYRPTIIDPDALRSFDSTVDAFHGYHAILLHILEAARTAASSSELIPIMDEQAAPLAGYITTSLRELGDVRAAQATETNAGADEMYGTLSIWMIVIATVAVVVALVLAFYISGLISKPLKTLDEWLNLTAKEGAIVFTDEELVLLDRYGTRRDEIGDIFVAYDELIKFMNAVCDDLREVANGNLTVDVIVRGEYDLLAQELGKMVDSLNSMFSEINNATAQVASGSKQIADGAQSLAQGSTEQAASVQQLSSSIAEIAQKTKGNADNAGKAAVLANDIKSSAEKGNRQMDEMMNAVKDINESSQNISKVIKSIDDIAFQTNILALNAAVEAARAGQHGKGFAVVAEEVRNLAAKSAAAAKDTESLIADSVVKAELGSKIADETAASLVEIVAGIDESSRLVSDIAKSSEEQSVSIEQVNTGVDQVAQVVQQNSATAEQSAAASEEMSGQSDMLEELISRFKLKDSGGAGRISAQAAPVVESLPPPAKARFEDGFGKY